jgi:hypothetical protein
MEAVASLGAPEKRSRARHAVLASFFMVVAISGCTQNATARAHERALGDAAYEYAETRWCLDDVVVTDPTAGGGTAAAVECFQDDFRQMKADDIPRMGRGSYVLAVIDQGDTTQITAITAGFAVDNSGGGSASDSAAACWSVTIDWASLSMSGPEGIDCDSEVLERTNGRASDEGLNALESRVPTRDDT